MKVIIIIFAVALIAAVFFVWKAFRQKPESQTDEQPANDQLSSEGSAVIKIKSGTWYMCTKDILPYVAGVVYLGADIDPSIKLWFKYFREATQEEIDEQHPTPAPSPTPEPEPDTEELMLLADQLTSLLAQFKSVVNVDIDSETYYYLLAVAWEAHNQYFNDKSVNNLPLFVKEENFPCFYNYWGDRKNEGAAFATMLGAICSYHLSELCPDKKNQLEKIGYEAGGYTMSTPIYGWEFRSDHNIMRIIGASILSTMNAVVKPDFETMRKEVGGNAFDRDLYKIVDEESRYNVKDGDFYIDFRNFLNSAAGPYAPGYTDRSKNNPTFPDEKASNGSLKVDMDALNQVIENNNIPESQAVQATADKDWDEKHLYGFDIRGLDGKYDFNAVFGGTTIGIMISPSSKLAEFLCQAKIAGGNARGILQHANPAYGPIEYGRLRPGCSWEREGCKHSTTDDRQNVLANFTIEDGDGNPTGYYDAHGNWVKPNECKSAAQYEEMQKNALYANSYPSGHSSGIMCLALSLMQVYPDKADLILRAANRFSINRTIARYHWLSDTIQGRVVGACMAPIVRATKDYYKLLEEAMSV